MSRLWRGAPAVDEAVLAELRAIRTELQRLSERIADAMPRAEITATYLQRETFEQYVTERRRVEATWRGWLPIAVSCGALLWAVFGQHLMVR